MNQKKIIKDTNDVPEMSKKLLELSQKGERSTLACVIFNWFSKVICRIFRAKRIALLLTSLFIFLATLVITLGITRLGGPLVIVDIIQLIIACFGFSLVLSVIKKAYGILVPAIVEIAIETLTTEKSLREIYRWLENVLNIKKQLFLSISLPVVTISGVGICDIFIVNFDLEFSTYLSLVLIFFSGATLLYWAFPPPSYLRVLGDLDMRVFSYNPSQDIYVKRLAKLVMGMVLAGGLVVLLFIALSYTTFSSVFLVPITTVLVFWYILGVCSALILFAFSNYYLSRIIQLAKQKLLCELQSSINRYYDEARINKNLDVQKIEAVMRTLDLHNKIQATPNSSLNWEMVRSLFSSIFLQTLPFLIAAIDWSKLLSLLNK